MTATVLQSVDDTTMRFAQNELSHYLRKMLPENSQDPAQASIRLVLNKDPHQDELDHVRITMEEGQGKIEGNHPVVVLIGVYQLLHHFGARFVRPGRNNEVIPSITMDVFNQPFSYDHKASYKHRGVCIEGADSVENIMQFIDWLPKIGFNTFFVQFENPYTFFKRWYTHEFNSYWDKGTFTNAMVEKMSRQVDEAIATRGLKHHRVGHGWTGEVLGYSSKFGWESGLRLPEEKEKFVAEVNGKRALIDGTPILTSLDFSNPVVIPKMSDVVVQYAEQHPEVDYLHVWLSDANNNICECEQCRKELPADQYVRFLNYLDQELTAHHLNTKICFLLYHELLFAPAKEKIKNPERFTMMFAPISRTFEKSYADVNYTQDIPAPAVYKRNQTTLPTTLEENLSFLFDWQKGFKGDSFVYDYPLGRAHYGDLGYMNISRIISRDVKYLSHLHLHGYISCQELRAGFPTTFPNYVMGQTLWDKETNFEDLRQEYFEAAYGKSTYPAVVKYLQKVSDDSSSDYFNAIGPRVSEQMSKRYQRIVAEARDFLPVIRVALSEVTGTQKKNWEVLDYHRQSTQKLAQALSWLADGQTDRAEAEWQEFVDFIKLNEKFYQPYLDVYRIIEVATNYAGFKYRDAPVQE
ncbi:DUF4838 domain-containing protein [Schleiferilactobacillus perolens]|uniref:DUF4838 domain-containing protein n=1 Tax=Schleiferilactobacillus perolens DSM 12744 TaxID=1423792 RepID=A0A0R1NA93_9LACO|nr:DUF4838 domain-containing protein [Schleiferilactobacillus perolens]KRL14490.1 hypothetical protein FD09_GL000138 [Schleiferilactobacillus perolens DSM 12744]